MSIIKAYQLGWSSLFKHKRMWFFLYVANLLFALAIALPIQNWFAAAAEHSLSINNSLHQFDFTFISDMLNQYGISIPVISNQLQMVILLYILFSILLNAGIIYVFLKPEKFSFANFGKGSFQFFWRYLRLSIYFLIAEGLLLYIIFKLYSLIAGSLNIFEMESDTVLINAFNVAAPIFVFLLIIVKMIQDFTKIEIVKSNERLLLKPIAKTFKNIASNLVSFFGLYLLNIIIAIGFIALYFLIKHFIPNSSATLLPLFIFSQLFVILRIALKLVNYKSAIEIYQNKNKEIIH